MEVLSRNVERLNATQVAVHQEDFAYYKDGVLTPISLSFNADTSNAGDILLNGSNSYTVGIRKDGNLNKLVGFRPDTAQDGSRQFEISIDKIEYDGIEITPSISPAVSEGAMVDMGDSKLEIGNGGFKQYFKATDIKDFNIGLKFDLKGFSIKNALYESEQVIRDSVYFEFEKIGQDIGENIVSYYKLNPPARTDKQMLSFQFGQITDEHINLGGYTLDEQFSDPSLDGYTTTIMITDGATDTPNGGSTYLKDAICFYVEMQNLEESYLKDIMVNNICEKFGVELLEAEIEEQDGEVVIGVGEYFIKDGKKVGSLECSEGKFFGYFNTKPIPDKVKDLFKNKTFNDVSYLDIDLDTFIDSFKEQFDYNISQVNVDSDYYASCYNQMVLHDGERDKSIFLPSVYNEAMENLDLPTFHTLNKDLMYNKYLTAEGILLNKLKGLCYIDVDITAGTVLKSKKTGSTQSASRKSTTGGTQTYSWDVATGGTSFNGNTTYSTQRMRNQFDTSSISGATSGYLKMNNGGINLGWKANNLDSSTVWGIKLNPTNGSSSTFFNDFSGWASSGSYLTGNYDSGGTYEDEVYFEGTSFSSSSTDSNNPTTQNGWTGYKWYSSFLSQGYTLQEKVVEDALIDDCNSDNTVYIMYLHDDDMKDATYSSALIRAKMTAGTIKLILTVPAVATENAVFFGSNF